MTVCNIYHDITIVCVDGWPGIKALSSVDNYCYNSVHLSV